MYLQGKIKKIISQMKAKKSDLQTQLSSAAARFEETEHRRHVAETKLTELQTLHMDLDLRHNNLQASYDAIRAQLEQMKNKESATKKRIAAMKEQILKEQVIVSCGSD
jgi:chromosome segregation ATPase